MGQINVTDSSNAPTGRLVVPETWVPVAARGELRRSGSGPILMVPSRYQPIVTWVRRLNNWTQGLKRHNDRAVTQSRDLSNWFMAVRALSGLTSLIAEFGNRNVYPSDSARRQRTQDELERRAGALQQLCQNNRNKFADPVPHFRRETFDGQNRLSEGLLRMLGDGDNAALVAQLAGDSEPSYGHVQKGTLMNIIAMAVIGAIEEVGKSPRHAEIAERCERSLQTGDERVQAAVREQPQLRSQTRSERLTALENVQFASDDPLATIMACANIVGGAAGTMPLGTDSLAMAYARVVITARSLGSHRWSSGARARLDAPLERYLHAFGDMSPSDAASLRQAVQTADQGHVDWAQDFLSDRFQTSTGFNLAATTLAALQFAYVVHTASEREGGATARDLFDGAVAAGQTGTSVIYTIARIGRSTSRPVSRGGIIHTARRMQRFIDEIDAYPSTFLAVVSIVDGAFLVAQGQNEQNALTQAIGYLTIGSGACIVGAAIATGLEFTALASALGPLGVALGLVATAVGIIQALRQAGQPPTVQVLEQLNSTISNSSNHGRSSLDEFSNAFDRIISWIRDHYHDDYSIGHTGTVAQINTMRGQLSALGFDDSQVNTLVPAERF